MPELLILPLHNTYNNLAHEDKPFLTETERSPPENIVTLPYRKNMNKNRENRNQQDVDPQNSCHHYRTGTYQQMTVMVCVNIFLIFLI